MRPYANDHPLTGVFSKLDRADDHLQVIDQLVDDYLRSKPPPVSGTFEARGDGGAFVLNWDDVHIAPLPAKLAVVVGDWAHNVRSALDHLAWQLVLANGGTPLAGARGTQFPILVPSEGDPPWNPDARKPAIVGGIDDEALQIVEAVQPNQWPVWFDHPLRALHYLSNTDKHRTLLTQFIRGDDPVVYWEGDREPTWPVRFEIAYSIEVEGRRIVVAFVSPPELDVSVNGRCIFEIEIQHGDHWQPIKSSPLMDVLRQSSGWIGSHVVARLAPYVKPLTT